MPRTLVTGGAGFVGSHVVRRLVADGHEVHVLDALTYAADLGRLEEFERHPGKPGAVWIWRHDIRKPLPDFPHLCEYDHIVHMAAETHVDRSIADPEPFVLTNVLGTLNVLQLARRQPNLRSFLYFSTDEVFGPAPDGTAYGEWDRYRSGNPYAATKAGGEELAVAFANTYRLPVIVTHTMNVFGADQHPEKFIPSTVAKVLAGETVTIHSSPQGRPGSRFYIHADDVAGAVSLLLDKGRHRAVALSPGEADKFNIVGEVEVDNLTVARMVANILGRDLTYELVDFHSSRPGHDLRYALDGQKMRDVFGWRPPHGTFARRLEDTVRAIAERVAPAVEV